MTDSDLFGKAARFVGGNWRVPLLYLLFVAVGMWVRAPYRDAFFWADDIKFLREIGLIQTGQLSFASYLFVPEFAKHSLPLGKLSFYWQWHSFGLTTSHWRLLNELTQGCAALLLFRLMRLYGARPIGALLGALAWSGAAIGGVDSPLSWLMCFHWALSLTFTLAAMVAIAKLPRHALLAPWVIFVATGGALLAGVSTFPTLIVLAPQILTLRRFIDRDIPAWALRRAFIAVLLGGVVFGLPQMVALTRDNLAGNRVFQTSAQELAERTAAQSIAALTTLVYDYPAIMPLVTGDRATGASRCRELFEKVSRAEPQTARRMFPHQFGRLDARIAMQAAAGEVGKFRGHIVPGLAALGLLVLTSLLGAAPQRCLLGLVVGMAVCQSLLINLGGTNRSLWEAISYTHYLFFATLAWCVCLGLLADGVICRLARWGAGWLGILCFVPLGFELVHQRHVAEDGRQMFDAAASTDIILHHWLQQALERIRQDQRKSQSTLRLPDLHVGLTNLTEEHFPLSAYLALTCREGIPNVVVVPGSKLTRAEWRSASRALSQGNDLAAKFWADNVSSQYEITQLVQWLMPISLAQDKPLAVPDIVLSSSLSVNLSSFVKLSHGTSTDLLEFVPCESVSSEQLQALLRVLQGPPDPARQWWIDQIEKLRRGRPSDMENRPKSAD